MCLAKSVIDEMVALMLERFNLYTKNYIYFLFIMYNIYILVIV
jgi:hypothetical protein